MLEYLIFKKESFYNLYLIVTKLKIPLYYTQNEVVFGL
jgi:hypothetical protein